MIVVDTNVVTYLYVASAETAAAERLLRRDAEWAAPLLWRSEFRNVLVVLIRRRVLTREDAYLAAVAAERRFAGREHSIASQDVIRMATDSGCTAYDCEYVAVAAGLSVPLVTTDRQVLRAFPRIAIPLE